MCYILYSATEKCFHSPEPSEEKGWTYCSFLHKEELKQLLSKHEAVTGAYSCVINTQVYEVKNKADEDPSPSLSSSPATEHQLQSSPSSNLLWIPQTTPPSPPPPTCPISQSPTAAGPLLSHWPHLLEIQDLLLPLCSPRASSQTSFLSSVGEHLGQQT